MERRVISSHGVGRGLTVTGVVSADLVAPAKTWPLPSPEAASAAADAGCPRRDRATASEHQGRRLTIQRRARRCSLCRTDASAAT